MTAALRVGSLFTGYGGLDSAVRQVLGGELAWVSDNHPSAVKLLAHHHPDVLNLGDITAIDWNQVEPVDVLAGGFPCQDLSPAGLGAGLMPGTRSGLWAHMAAAISVLRPRLVVIENVRGLCSAPAHSDLEPCPWCVGDDEGVPLRALGAVLGDLADCGYDADWCGLRAADVGAPHGRFRIFVVARRVAGDATMLGRDAAPAPVRGGEPAGTAGGPGVAAADPDSTGLEGREPARGHELPAWGAPADTASARRGRPRGVTPGPAQGVELEAGRPVGRGGSAPAADSYTGGLGADEHHVRAGQPDADRSAAADPDGDGQQQREGDQPDLAGRVGDGGPLDWGDYGPAVHRWESVLGRPAPDPTVLGRRGQRVLNAVFVEWLMGLPAGHVTHVPGLSRNDQLRLLGNGVVPQQGAAALRFLLAAHLAEVAA